MLARRALGAGVALVVAVTLGASCTTIIGVDSEYHDAATGICLCTDLLALFSGSQSKCRTYLDDGLRKATPEQQAAWLDVYQRNHCDSCSTDFAKRLECIFASPVCVEAGENCTDPLQCCGYLDFTGAVGSKAACLPNGDSGKSTCQACVPIGESCSISLQCCGYPYVTTNQYDPPYCDPLSQRCVVENPGCYKTGGGPCADDSQCCGSESGLGHCTLKKTCEEVCNPDDPVNCPGCCGETSGIGIDAPYQCLDGKDIAKCPLLCQKGVTECAEPTACDSVCNSLHRCISLCQ